MRFPVVFSIWASLAATSLLNGAQLSETRDLPPLKLAASELDTILSKIHLFVSESNGPAEAASTRESVRLGVRGHEIEIPHFSLASSVAFPNEIFGFGYTYSEHDRAISSVTIELGDSSRRISVTGESPDKVRALSNLLDKELRQHSTPIGGMKFRRLVGVCLSMLFLISLMLSGAYCWKTRNSRAIGMPICSALGFLLLVLLPWNWLLPGFVLYQRYSAFFLIRHASQISVLALVTILAGIPLSYFLSRNKR